MLNATCKPTAYNNPSHVSSRPFILLLLLTCGTWVSVHAQSSEQTTDTTEHKARGVVDNPTAPDSVLKRSVYSFRLKPIAVKLTSYHNLSLDPTDAQHHDPLNRMDGHYYLSKGIVGQSHTALYPTLAGSLEWHYQPDINIGYTRTPENQNYYQTRRPYTLLSYGSSLKKEYTLRAFHTQNIMPRWNFAVDYQLFNPDPIYSNEETKNNYLTLTSNYYSSDSRYQAYVMYLWQRYTIGENGGLVNDNTFRNNLFSDLSGIPVNSYTDISLYNSKQLYVHQSYNFVRQVDRVKKHELMKRSITDSTVFDTIVSYDTVRASAHHIINPGVVGMDATIAREARRFDDSTTIHHQSLSVFWTNDAYPDARYGNPWRITLAAKPQHHRINEFDSIRYEWNSLIGSLQLVWVMRNDTLTTSYHHTTGYQMVRNDRLAQIQYTHRFDSIHLITLSAEMSRKSPDFFYYHYHSNGYSWDNSQLKKEQIQRYQLQFSHLNRYSITMTANRIANRVVLEAGSGTLRPNQDTVAVWLLQAQATLHLQPLKWMHYRSEQSLQYSSNSDQWDLPLWASKNSVYAEFSLFHKAMRMQTGIDIRYHSLFYVDAYNPAAGAFVRQREVKVGNYYWGDIFVNMQIQRMTIYLKLGHINALWEMNPEYFLLPHYPGNKFGFYYGLTWNLFD